MKILMLTRIIPPDYEEYVSENSKNTMGTSSDNFQKKMIDGIDKIEDISITLFNYLPVQSYPKSFKKIYIRHSLFNYNDIKNNINIGFMNLFLMKRIFMVIGLKKQLIKYIKANREDNISIIAYSMMPEFINASNTIKKKFPFVRMICIVPDLPQYTILDKKISIFSRLYLYWAKSVTLKLYKKLDGLIYFSEHMNEIIPIDRYLVIEGISEDYPIIEKSMSNAVKNIVYAGKLNDNFGIMELVKAVVSLDDDSVILNIFGTGESLVEIENWAEKSPSIKLHGLTKHSEVISVMRNSDLIVNPRKGAELFTRYSFPSKNLEALSIGVPLLAYKLPGIPNEYDEYINYVKGEQISDLATSIKDILYCKENFYFDKAYKAQIYVKKYKNKYFQAAKIIEFIGSLK